MALTLLRGGLRALAGVQSARPFLEDPDVLAGDPNRGLGVDEQGRAAALPRPPARLLVVAVVDPSQRTVRAGVGVDRGQLPVRPPAGRRGVERQVGQRPRQAELARQVLVGALLPPAAPHELERLSQIEQVRAGGGRKEMTVAVDEQEAPGWTFVGVEVVERDYAVDVDQEQGLSSHVLGNLVTIETRRRAGRPATLLALVRLINAARQVVDYQFQAAVNRTSLASAGRGAASPHL